MQKLMWNITKFNHVLSYPSDAGDGAESYAQDMVNLRVDRWGHLRLRPAIRALQMHEAGDIAPADVGMVGVAASITRLFWLNSNAQLYVTNSIPADPLQITGVPLLSGRLSLVELGENIVLTSEDSDQGYAIGENNEVEQLGIAAPDVDVFGSAFFNPTTNPVANVIASFGQLVTQLPASPIDNRIYQLRADQEALTTDDRGNTIYVADYETGAALIAGTAGDLFLQIEPTSNLNSESGVAGATSLIVTGEARAGHVFRRGTSPPDYVITSVVNTPQGQQINFTPGLVSGHPDNTILVIQPSWWRILVPLQDEYSYYKLTFEGEGLFGDTESNGSAFFAVKLPDRTMPDEIINDINQQLVVQITQAPGDTRITHLNLYRSDVRRADGDDGADLNYYRVEQFSLESASFPIYFVDDTADTVVTNKLEDNSYMPSSIEQLVQYNDRLFGANGNELRFSDVRNTIPIWGAWPVLNSIRTGQRVDFAAAYRGMLLFGASDNLHRLSGTSPANFRYDQISSRGPVSPHSWGILDNAFAFVGADGLYLTDGTKAPEIAPQLKGYFNRYEIEDGFVGMLPNKASLWGIHRRNKSTDDTDIIYFVKDGNDWTRVSEGSSERIASAIENPSSERIASAIENPSSERSTERIAKAIEDPIASAIEIPDATAIRQYASVKFDGLPITGVIADQQRAPRLIDWVVDDASVDGITHYTGGTPVEEDIAWSWESQQLDWNAHGFGEEMKVFTELDISGIADNDATITFYIDDRAPVTKTVRLDRAAHDRFHPVRVRINRRGFGCRFKLEGTGAVTLRGLQMKGWV